MKIYYEVVYCIDNVEYFRLHEKYDQAEKDIKYFINCKEVEYVKLTKLKLKDNNVIEQNKAIKKEENKKRTYYQITYCVEDMEYVEKFDDYTKAKNETYRLIGCSDEVQYVVSEQIDLNEKGEMYSITILKDWYRDEDEEA